MSTIKISELATSAISLTDFFAKADASGIASKNNIQGLSNFLNTVETLAFRGVLLAANAAVTEDGIYVAGDAGTYTNNGGLVITVNDKIVLISITGTQTVFEKAEFPITLTLDATPTEGSVNLVESGGIYPLKRDIEIISNTGKSYKEFTDFVYVSGSYVNTSGVLSSNAGFQYVEIPVNDYNLKVFTQDGSVVALISYWDDSNAFISYEQTAFKGYYDIIMTVPSNTSFIRVSSSINSVVYLTRKDLDVSSNFLPNKNKNDLEGALLIGQEYISFTDFTYVDGFYVNDIGTTVSNASFRYVEINANDYKLTAEILAGTAVALITYFDVDLNFLGFQEKGDGVYTDLLMVLPTGTNKIRISTNINKTISLYLKDWDIATKKWVSSQIPASNDILNVQTWGNSITEYGQYQVGISNELGINIANVKNAGLASDFSQHVRNRFISYFTDVTPYKGTANYSTPSLADRLIELNNSFFVFWIGTNNLLQVGSSDKFKNLYANSYQDQILNDLRLITQKLTNGNFAIIGGHGAFSTETATKLKMDKLNDELVRMYPRNVIDIKSIFNMDYDYLNTFLDANFVKPNVSSTVDITLTDVSWIGDSNKNASSNICVGTKDIYDKYSVDSIVGNVATCTLLESNTNFITGDTILKDYDLVSDLNRDTVTMPTQVFSFEDCQFFEIGSLPRSATDPVHFLTVNIYRRVGELIAKEMTKINRL